MKQSVLHSATQSQEIDAMMAIETLVLGIDHSLPEYWIDLLILYRGAVLLEILADKAAEKEQKKPRNKREVVRGGEAWGGQPQRSKHIGEIEALRNLRAAEKYAAGSKPPGA